MPSVLTLEYSLAAFAIVSEASNEVMCDFRLEKLESLFQLDYLI